MSAGKDIFVAFILIQTSLLDTSSSIKSRVGFAEGDSESNDLQERDNVKNNNDKKYILLINSKLSSHSFLQKK